MLIIFYKRRVIAKDYEVLNFIKLLKRYKIHRARISDIKSRKTEENLVFINSKKEEGRKK